ncbi:Membrane protein [Mycena sanguinolenta]|uniref:Membrane protein n=1 Tax=Mycena sanguinolenta TaxID=230812 RepID=A0A8H7DKK0_9AGAR|nr:Membrane protein [Mycena sanguinolenta]
MKSSYCSLFLADEHQAKPETGCSLKSTSNTLSSSLVRDRRDKREPKCSSPRKSGTRRHSAPHGLQIKPDSVLARIDRLLHIVMFFRFYHHPGRHLPLSKQVELRKELLAIAQTSFNPIPDYQCLSSRPDALDDKLIVVAYTGTDPAEGDGEENKEPDRSPCPVAFTSAMYLDVADLEHAVLHTGLTIAAPSVQRTGILVQLFAQLFLHVMPLHPDGVWVTTLAAVLSSLVQSATMLCNTYPCPPNYQSNQQPRREHLAIARAVDERYRAQLLISPDAEWDAESFVFRGSMDWSAAEVFKKGRRRYEILAPQRQRK